MRWLSLLFFLSTINSALAQQSFNRSISETDRLFTFQKMAVLPFSDNAQGIFARPLEADAQSRLTQTHRIDVISPNIAGPLMTLSDLEENPEKVKQMNSVGADGFLAGQIVKTPNGINLTLSLFSARDGKLFQTAQTKNFPKYGIEELKIEQARLMQQLMKMLPYSGVVLSRENQKVTVSLGRNDGVKEGQLLSVIQLLAANRHPKFNFVLGFEKETIGKIRLTKVDQRLSFGQVVTEKEKGFIEKGSKIGTLDEVVYEDPMQMTPVKEETEAQKAWKPMPPPSLGQVGALMGLTMFSRSLNIPSVSSLEASTPLAPTVGLYGELWLTPQWAFHGRIRQSIITVKNPRSNSSPSTLSQSYSAYDFDVGYMFRFGTEASAPFAEPLIGFFNYKLYSDDASPNQSFTSMTYSGMRLGARGMVPVTEDGSWAVGGEAFLAFQPGLNETPVTSGSGSKNSVNQIGLFGIRRLSPRLNLRIQFDYEMFSTNFSGTGTRAESATSASQRYTTLSGGVFYMF